MAVVPAELDAALRALCEVGRWRSAATYPAVAADVLHATIRAACRARGFRVLGVHTADGRLWCCTFGDTIDEQALPGAEPWRSLAADYRAGGLPVQLLRETAARARGLDEPR